MSDRATQDDILRRIVDRLRAKIPEYADTVCFLCDQPQPVSWPDGPLCCVVSVSDGRFPEQFTTGGGASTLCKQITLEVTAWVRCVLDNVPSLDLVFLEEHGLWSTWEPAILRALLLETDSTGRADAWMPTDRYGAGLLRNQIAPLRTSAARPDATGQWMGLTISFGLDFDWRL